MQPVGRMQPSNYFSMAHNHISLQIKVECNLIFQSLSLQDQKLKSRNNPILHTFKKNIFNSNISEIYIYLFQRSIVVEE